MKKVVKLLSVLLVLSLLILTGCTSNSNSSSKGKDDGVLEIWTFTNEIDTMVNDYYLKEYPDLDYKIKVVEIPTEQFEQKLDPVLGSKEAPDVILMEANFAKKYVESGMLEDLSQFDVVVQGAENTFDYVKDVGTNSDGQFVANAWQAAPGAFFYRDSIAKEFLGLETPEDVQAAIGTWDDFYRTAVKLKEASNGEVYMVSSVADFKYAFLGTRDQGWVVDNKLVIDEKIYDLLEIAKKFNEEGLMLDAEENSESYYGGMSADNIFGYSLPTWGLHYWLKPNAESSDTGNSTAGDWRMVQGPAAYYRGGTWIGITQTSNMKEEAAELIAYVTTNEDFLTAWAKDTGDFVSNKSVVENIKGDYSEEFLGGQNHYAAFAEQIPNIDAKSLTEFDQTLNTLFSDHALIPYSKGEVDLDTAIENFKAAVQNSYPNLTIE
ncbi:ABC transporter substrate-binding protein [Caldibacillus thermolactis]|jgi:multiple sugar transport system substrate-binding protein|uniref:ABC transporter substrate-binding protein n=1 Tax=Pallidibacillus thermolactis TaxID=251051 RepID=A0ABT2WJF1_9BACI|nr:ABC transporter substrate-binding protein [Pallidibacillus thermolactis]MCU9595818.1 ABC transporter substrate-binding protein [Pallidibacillus thermolactis]MED1673128.1 ABC transporter substrate-binding protein [Pallidibacillus thermolactis subsp. kokeshiiformis]